MATNITSVDPTLNSAGDVISLSLSGDSDRTRIQVQLSSPTNGAFFALQQVLPDPATGAWSLAFSVFAGDVKCTEDIAIDISWFDVPSNSWIQEDNYPTGRQIDCSQAGQCSVTISSLEGIEASTTGMSEVIVRGTASSCSQVRVTVFDVNPSTEPIEASAVVLNGTWEAHFVLGDVGVGTRIKSYECKEVHTVHAECATDAGCFAEGDFEVECAEDCAEFADVQVRNASGTLRVLNPEVGRLQCLQAGRYTLAVTAPDDADVASYTWYRNQNQANPVGTARTLDITLGNQENVSYTVAIETVDDCSPTRTVVFSCGQPVEPSPDDGGGNDDNGNGDNGNGNGGNGNGDGNGNDGNGDGGCDACCIWNWINIGLFVVAAVFVLITFCMLEATAVSAIIALASGGTLAAVSAALSTVNIVMLVISACLLVVGLISWLLWLIFCCLNNPNACSMLATLMVALSYIVTISLVLALILGALQRLGCVAGALIVFAWFGTILAITTLVYTALGCFDEE